MTRFLLDTDALIDFSKGAEPATSLILEWIAGSDVVAVCATSIAEFYAGLPDDQRPRWDQFFASLTYWDISRSAAAHAGQDRYSQTRKGLRVTTTDALLAALAREYHATLVTGNVKDFPQEGLQVLSTR